MNGILIDKTGDLSVGKKGLQIGDVRADVAERIVIAHPGEFKESPPLGCNLREAISGRIDPFFRGNAVEQLQSEGIEVEELNITPDNLELKIRED